MLKVALEQANAETVELSSSSSTKSGRKSSRVCSKRTVLPKKCIFCNRDKYVKNTRNREKLSSCIQIRADENIRKVATQKNDAKVLAITTDELVAKEAHYHFTCYRSYTRKENMMKKFGKKIELKSNDKKEDETGENETTKNGNGQTDMEQSKCEEGKEEKEAGEKTTNTNMQQVIKFLLALYEKPDIVPLSLLQDMLSGKSEKKNLKRNIENKCNDFKFVKYGKTFLIYPVTFKIEDMVSKLYDSNLQIGHMENMTSSEKIITQAANIVKNEIKDWKGELSWPPKTDEFEMANFVNPPNLDSLLTNLLKEGGAETSRVSRLKSSIGQDLIYAGK